MFFGYVFRDVDDMTKLRSQLVELICNKTEYSCKHIKNEEMLQKYKYCPDCGTFQQRKVELPYQNLENYTHHYEPKNVKQYQATITQEYKWFLEGHKLCIAEDIDSKRIQIGVFIADNDSTFYLPNSDIQTAIVDCILGLNMLQDELEARENLAFHGIL